MGLTCTCDSGDWGEPGDKVWGHPQDYAPLNRKRSKKCCSCGDKINVGDICCEVTRGKIPEYEVEINIYGEDGEVPMAPAYMCERCADLAFSLKDLGFCMQPWEDQRELVKDYAAFYQPQKLEKAA
jgi:hypothetical protein